MKEVETAKVLVFSEEYVRVTKGLFAVWTTHAAAASKQQRIAILLNRGHWALAEVEAALAANARVEIGCLPFSMPSALLARALAVLDRWWLLRSSRIALGEFLNLLALPLIVLYFYRTLRRIRPQVVFSHSGGWPAGPLCRWIIYGAALAGVPARILIIHNFPRTAGGRIWGWLAAPMRWVRARSLEKWSTAIVTVSDSVKATLDRAVFKRPVVRVHNGIELASRECGFAPPSDRPNWKPTGPTVGFVGALFPLKGPHVLLDAFKLVETPSELAMLGPADPEYLKSLQLRATQCANRVSFLGYHEDVDWFMQQIDLLVVPSIAFESFGMVILEAMKHKKAVICTDFGGMKEVVQDGVTGMVVKAGDAVALSGAITALLTDSRRRDEMGDAGYRRLCELFTADKMVERYDALVAAGARHLR
jgi:teichuronic acid biosynthesis glycosyltransferase TuaC